jgi:hypothetical protein
LINEVSLPVYFFICKRERCLRMSDAAAAAAAASLLSLAQLQQGVHIFGPSH